VIKFDGQPAVQGIVLDIDDSKKLDQRIFRAHKMEAVGRLAGGVAHDFNNLLTAILGYSKSMVRKLDPEDPLHESAREISYAANRAAALTRQLLAFSRKQAMKPELFNVNGIVHGMWNMLSSLISSNIQVILRLTPEMGLVKANPGQLEQVLMNLVLNARDAMQDGGTLTIETTLVELGADELKGNPDAVPGPYVHLAVRDTGIGLDEKRLDHIFEPFFSTKGLGEGTGLGLSVVYGIIQQHGGVISVESRPGQGSCFRIYLPLSADQSDQDAGETLPEPPVARKAKRVLVVEDEHVVRRFVASVLREFGYEVAEAESAEEVEMNYGRDLAGFNLLLVDIMLPGRSGIKLVKELTAGHNGLAVVMTSGYAVKEAELDFVRVSNFQYLQKPFSEEELIASVRRALEANGQGEVVDTS
jgi:nitrogen-specific signal transduction histidine kinase/CheY-like chemotaxis protein